MKIFVPVTFALLAMLLTRCTDDETKSPFQELLVQAPYKVFTDSIRENSGNDNLYFRRGILLRKNDLKEPALADFKKAWSLKSREEYAANISALLLERRPDSAIAFINGALRQIPASIFLKLDLARAYQATHAPNDAIRVCNEILEKAPAQLDAMVLKSELLEDIQDSSGAMASLEKAYSLAPFDLDLNYNLAFKYAQNRNPKAVALCDSLLKQDATKNHPEPYYFKGVYYSNVNEKDKAIGLFKQAIQHDFHFLDAYLDMGRTLYEQKKINDALAVFNKAATVSPAYADAYYWIGKCLQANGKLVEAKENYQRAYGFDKTLTEARDSATGIRSQ